jgi:hypothetical protein
MDHKGSAQKKREKLRKSYYTAEVLNEIRAEERGEDIAAEIIERAIRALLASPAPSGEPTSNNRASK